MAEIIKFPEQPPTCGDCGKPLESEEGKICPIEGCETVGCGPCTEVSTHCLTHMELDPILCPETRVEDITDQEDHMDRDDLDDLGRDVYIMF